MVLHIFNPSHDEALAANYPYYYPSAISRKIADLWGGLPAIWAKEGDIVLLSGNPSQLLLMELQEKWGGRVRFVGQRQVSSVPWEEIEYIDPWGWDLPLRHRLKKMGVPFHLLPSDEQLATTRRLSGRATTALMLPLLREKLERGGIPTAGQSVVATNMDDTGRLLQAWNGGVVKSLWSCSGRGVFYAGKNLNEPVRRRIERLLDKYGGVEIEPRYEPTATFALEFFADKEKGISCLGVSLFHCGTSGAYSGNVVASQTYILRRLGEMGLSEKWVSPLSAACAEVAGVFLNGHYSGPFGIDMMMVRSNDGEKVFPCMETNLRRTMGHVALEMARRGIPVSWLPKTWRALWTTAGCL